ncbi:erythromycin esterase family protein [Ureibacillus sp. MALMAid1270]|uniref:erythromycin esterase family protein n=1 Tax=Ureibacillus sp. MALMAid1270 TaxID=3411629 RepID=UPI003BA43EC2
MSRKLINAFKEHSLPLNDESLNKIVEAIGTSSIVTIGKTSHGTSEFYTIRAELSKKLINEKGFNIIAVEGDWPSVQAINRYVKGYGPEGKSTREVLVESFNRWPTWMWAVGVTL